MADYGPVQGRGLPRAGTYGGGQNQRDAAFSDIFGAAPPGRSQTMTGQDMQYAPQQERSATMTSASQPDLYPAPQIVPRQMPMRGPPHPNGYGPPGREGYPPQQRVPSGPPPQQPPAQYLPQPLNTARRPVPQPQRVGDPRQGPPAAYGRSGPLPNRGSMPMSSGPAMNNDPLRSRSMAGIPPSGYQSYNQAPAGMYRQQQYQQQHQQQHPASRTTAYGRVVPERHDERAQSMTTYSTESAHATQTMSGRFIPQPSSNTSRRRESDATITEDRSDTLSQASTVYSGYQQQQQRAVSQPGVGGSRTMSMASNISVDMSNRTSSLVHRPSMTKMNGANGSATQPTKQRAPVIYPALLSRVCKVFLENVEARERQKNGLSYQNAFSGKEAVDLISFIIRTSDRNLALLLGRALDAQKLFHDVTYEHRLRDSSTELYQFDETQQLEDPTEKINGVFTLLTECYSPTCTRDNLCYSIACPRRLEQQQRLNMKPQPGLQRQLSTESLHAEDNEEQKLWINTVSKEVADSVSDKEKKRQEVISEIMYTERDFVKDLEYLRDFWIKPLRTHAQGHTPIIPEARREMFVRTVFANVMDVHSVNYGLAGALTKRQQEGPVVNQIGDVFLQYVHRFEPFIRYGANQLYGKWEFESEKQRNHIFAKFVEEVERMKESRKLELNGYLTKPTTRLARYPLLLENVHKYTAEGNPDRENIPKVITLIKDFLARVNKESGRAENHFNLMQLDANLRWDPSTAVELKLKEEGREIIFKCGLKKSATDSGEITVYVFDHAILMVKAKQEKKAEQLRVYRRPIALELLQIAQMDDVNKRQLNPLANRSGPAAQPGKEGFPITFKNLGRHTYEITLFATSQTMRQKLMQHIETQQTKLFNRNKPYTRSVLCSNFFNGFNKVNCMVPTDGGRKLVYGTDQGIFVSERKRTNDNQPRKVLVDLRNVTQLDVLEAYNMLLVLADKALLSLSLDVLQPGDVAPALKKPQRIQSHANFFRAGVCVGRHLVCSAKSSGLSTTIKVFEPTDHNAKNKKGFLANAFGGNSSDQLKPLKEFYIPAESSSIHFLKSKLCVACTKGFEIVSLDTLETQSLLDQADTSLDFVVRETRDVKPIHIERLNGEFLLCYSDFSFFVNRNGWRARHDLRIDWEGRPESFALSYPHIIAFEPNFIEIRHVETAVSEHILTARNIRMLHASTREIIYAYSDSETGVDVIASLDFWSKAEQQNGRESYIDGNGK